MLNKVLSMSTLLGFLFVTGAHVQAREEPNPPTKTATEKKPKKPKGQAGASAKFIPGSEETKKERSARLTRECKGQVNAGACSGYTR